MLIDPGNHLGDSWYFVDDDTVHAFYLVCPDTVERHSAWDIAHATSVNLVDWDLHGVVVRRGDRDAWDRNCLATGSVIRYGDEYLMAYTARWNQPDVATGLATSDDLHRWTKAPTNPNTRPGSPYVVNRQWSDRPPTHWRDPFLIEIDGILHQLIAASRPDRPSDSSGTVGVSTSIDAQHWELRDPIDVEPVARELECPQTHEIDGRWFLIFSAFPELFSAEIQADPNSNLRHGTYAMIGDGPLGPYRFIQRECVTPPNHPDHLYAGQIITFGGTSYLMGTVWCDDAPDYLSNPIPLRRNGTSLHPA